MLGAIMTGVSKMSELIHQAYSSLSTINWIIFFESLLITFIGLALVAVVIKQRESSRQVYQRTIIALAILLAVHSGEMLFAFLAQIDVVEGDIMPALLRGGALLSATVLVWLWCFPEKQQTADTIALVIGILASLILLLGILWLPSLGIGHEVNRLLIDLVGGVFALTLLAAGIVTILFRRPILWGFGLFSLSILAAGYVIHMIGLLNNYEYPTAVFIASIIVYPVLLLLPLRLTPPKVEQQPEMSDKEKEDLLRHIEQQQAILDRRPSFTDPKILQSIIDIMDETGQEEICQKIVLTISRIMRADICALLQPPVEDEELVVTCSYDSKIEKMCADISLPTESFPGINAAVRNGEIWNVPEQGDAPELALIAEKLSLKNAGPALLISVLSSTKDPISGLLLLSPYSGRVWTEGDEYYFKILAKLLVHFLQHSREMANLRSQLAESHRIELEVRDLYEETKIEHQLFLDQVSTFQEREYEEQAGIDSLETSEKVHPDAQVEQLRPRDEEESAEISRLWVPAYENSEIERLRSELQMALEEIALLKAELDEAHSGQ